MWNERRMTSGPGRRGQARHRCPRYAIGEDRPGPRDAQHLVERRRARRPPARDRTPSGASPPFRRGCHPPPERREQSRPGMTSRRRATPQRTEAGRATPKRGRNTTGLRIVEEHSSRRPIPGRDPVHALVAVRLARSHASKCARFGSTMWLVRCCCRRGPLEDPDAGAGGVATIEAVGARAGKLATRSTIERGGRLKGSRYATIPFSHPP